MAMQQEPMKIGGTYHMCVAYACWLMFQGVSPQDMAKHMVRAYFHLLDTEISIEYMNLVLKLT